ncbi:hypothetical protein BSK64_28305, partial [Paenibacillus odorifer]|uniref:hypothetical protein n=1 Tax=Paenibacillus odorifer TaxID=189426 RepID=UPI000979EDEE
RWSPIASQNSEFAANRVSGVRDLCADALAIFDGKIVVSLEAGELSFGIMGYGQMCSAVSLGLERQERGGDVVEMWWRCGR